MNDFDPDTAASLDDLAACLRHVHLLADKPSYRTLEDRTKHVKGTLPGTTIERVSLRRTALSGVLQARTFPRKGFLLTFAEACGVDLESDRRWGQAWDRLAPQYLDQAAEIETEVEQLRRQLAVARAQADRSDMKAEELRQQLAAAEDLIRQQALAAEEMAARLEAVEVQAREAHDRPTEATAAHFAELEQVRANAQARSAEAEGEDRDVPADQGTLVNRDVLVSHDMSASRDVPADQDESVVPDPQREVTVVHGVPRYHKADCILIRFMSEDDLGGMTIDAACLAGCIPCRACLPDEPVQEAQLSVNGACADEMTAEAVRARMASFQRGVREQRARADEITAEDPTRSASEIRTRMASFQRGVREGRAAAVWEEPQDQEIIPLPLATTSMAPGMTRRETEAQVRQKNPGSHRKRRRSPGGGF